jgi:hypothetical protein
MLTPTRFALLVWGPLALASGCLALEATDSEGTQVAGGPLLGEQGSGGSAQSGAGGGSFSTSGDAASYQALAACAGVQPCATAIARRAQGADALVVTRNVECVLGALRDRSVGVYEIELQSVHEAGTDVGRYRFSVTPTGAVETAAVQTVTDARGAQERFVPAERCELRAPDYYDDCIGALLQAQSSELPSQAAVQCVFPRPSAGPPWAEGCRPQRPSCE